MLRVALTGGIGSGKSTVLRRLAELGAAVIEADRVAHDVIAAGTPGAAAVRARFGARVMSADGSVDRRRLAEVVFADPQAREDLEAIVHPAVYRVISQWMDDRAADGVAVAVAEIPLLFETGRQGDFETVIVVACDEAAQLRRAVGRGEAEADARRRIAAQWPLEAKVRGADFVIDTSGAIADTIARTDEVWAALQAGAANDPAGRR